MSVGRGGTLGMAAAAAIPMGLGWWQIARLNWKRDQVELRRSTLFGDGAEPASLRGADVSAELLGSMVNRRVLLTGRFDHAEEVLVGIRQLPSAGEGERGQHGYLVLAPLQLQDGTRVLVNRGWVPREMRAPGRRAHLRPTDEATLHAVVRPGENGAFWMPGGKAASREWTFIDAAAIASATRSADCDAIFEVTASPGTEEAAELAMPRPRTLESYMHFPVTPYKHQVYAGTWFALSASSACWCPRPCCRCCCCCF